MMPVLLAEERKVDMWKNGLLLRDALWLITVTNLKFQPGDNISSGVLAFR